MKKSLSFKDYIFNIRKFTKDYIDSLTDEGFSDLLNEYLEYLMVNDLKGNY